MRQFIENVTRECSLFEIGAWYEGESRELEKWIGFGFYNTLFISKNGNVTLYYDLEEAERFHEILKEKLTKKFFYNLYKEFLGLIKTSIKTNEEVYNLYVSIFPALTIFDEISKYPEIANDDVIRRLVRIRKFTQSFAYDLINKVEYEDEPKDFIFFQGNAYLK